MGQAFKRMRLWGPCLFKPLQHLSLIQNQIPRSHPTNTVNKGQVNMSPSEARHPTTTSAEYYNTAETQEKYIKSKIMKMLEYLQEKMNKSSKKSRKQ